MVFIFFVLLYMMLLFESVFSLTVSKVYEDRKVVFKNDSDTNKQIWGVNYDFSRAIVERLYGYRRSISLYVHSNLQAEGFTERQSATSPFDDVQRIQKNIDGETLNLMRVPNKIFFKKNSKHYASINSYNKMTAGYDGAEEDANFFTLQIRDTLNCDVFGFINAQEREEFLDVAWHSDDSKDFIIIVGNENIYTCRFNESNSQVSVNSDPGGKKNISIISTIKNNFLAEKIVWSPDGKKVAFFPREYITNSFRIYNFSNGSLNFLLNHTRGEKNFGVKIYSLYNTNNVQWSYSSGKYFLLIRETRIYNFSYYVLNVLYELVEDHFVERLVIQANDFKGGRLKKGILCFSPNGKIFFIGGDALDRLEIYHTYDTLPEYIHKEELSKTPSSTDWREIYTHCDSSNFTLLRKNSWSNSLLFMSRYEISETENIQTKEEPEVVYPEKKNLVSFGGNLGVYKASFSPDGKYFFVLQDDPELGYAQIFKFDEVNSSFQSILKTKLTENKEPVPFTVKWKSIGGRQIIFIGRATYDKKPDIYEFKPNTKKLVSIFKNTSRGIDGTTVFDISSSNDILFKQDSDLNLYKFNSENKIGYVGSPIKARCPGVRLLMWHPNEKNILAAFKDGISIYGYDSKILKNISTIKIEDGSPIDAVWNKDGTLLACLNQKSDGQSANGTTSLSIYSFSEKTQKLDHKFTKEFEYPVTSLSFSPYGKYLIISGDNLEVYTVSEETFSISEEPKIRLNGKKNRLQNHDLCLHLFGDHIITLGSQSLSCYDVGIGKEELVKIYSSFQNENKKLKETKTKIDNMSERIFNKMQEIH
jgi:hypothetical protein